MPNLQDDPSQQNNLSEAIDSMDENSVEYASLAAPGKAEMTAGEEQHHILLASVWDKGIVVSFSDGRTALFSAKLLRATLPRAQEMFSEESDS